MPALGKCSFPSFLHSFLLLHVSGNLLFLPQKLLPILQDRVEERGRRVGRACLGPFGHCAHPSPVPPRPGNWPCEPFTSNTVYHSSPSQDDGVLRDTIVHLFSINGSLADARCDGNTVTGAPTDHAAVLPGDGLPGASRSGTRRRKPNSFSGPRFPLLTQVNSQDETG